jgi:hypothetical protein
MALFLADLRIAADRGEDAERGMPAVYLLTQSRKSPERFIVGEAMPSNQPGRIGVA